MTTHRNILLSDPVLGRKFLRRQTSVYARQRNILAHGVGAEDPKTGTRVRGRSEKRVSAPLEIARNGRFGLSLQSGYLIKYKKRAESPHARARASFTRGRNARASVTPAGWGALARAYTCDQYIFGSVIIRAFVVRFLLFLHV